MKKLPNNGDYKPINITQARRVLEVVDAGLSSGLGRPKIGEMCVEAAVCFALGQPHGDEPKCVDFAVRSFKVSLNDKRWSSNAARAKGMRRVAIAQLGSRGTINDKKFASLLTEKTIRKLLPIAIRYSAKLQKKSKQKAKMEAAALRCENEGTQQSALDAREVCHASAAASASAAALAAYAAANAYAADVAAYSAAYSAAAASAASAAAYSAAAASAYAADANASAAASASAAHASAAAASAYAADANASAAAKRDEILTLAADICVDVLRQLGSPGIALMDELIPV